MKNPRSLLIIAMLIVAACDGCASARHTAILDAFTATSAAQAGFIAFDLDHQQSIVDSATSGPEARDRIVAYRAKRAKVVQGFEAAWIAIAAAVNADDDPSFRGMLSAIAVLWSGLKEIGVMR